MFSNQTISSPFFANMGKLSSMMLEGLMIRGGGIHIDDALGVRFKNNSCFVGTYCKIRSRCDYAYTLAKAINDVALGLGCKVNVTKTRRCSGTGEEAADALSKGDWERAWDNMPQKDVDPKYVPRVLLKVVANPYPYLTLGEKILGEMSNYTKVLYKAK